MSNSGSKGQSPFAIKVIVVLMSLLYVLGPVHLELKGFLHTIAHTLHMPDTVLSHQKGSVATHIHQSNEHKKAIAKHDHSVIELVEKILEGADNENETPNHLLPNHKIDKHISLRKSLDQDKDLFFFSERMHSFLDNENKLCRGYLNGFSKPPEVYKEIFI